MSENGNSDTFKRIIDKWCNLSDIPVRGEPLTEKVNNMIRMIFENVDRFVLPGKEKNRHNKNKHKKS